MLEKSDDYPRRMMVLAVRNTKDQCVRPSYLNHESLLLRVWCGRY